MSITLSAYPMAFLMSPEFAKNEKLRVASEKDTNNEINEKVSNENLCSIRVLTNLQYPEFANIMDRIFSNQLSKNEFVLPNSLRVELIVKGKYCQVLLSGCQNSKDLIFYAEEFFHDLDSLASRNVRLIESNEFFYYNYSTSYSRIKNIYEHLKAENAKNIYSLSNEELIAEVNGQQVRYFKEQNSQTYTLEVEQKVSILNIGLTGDYQGTNVTYGALKNLKIQTNIKQEELRQFLYKANYLYYEGNSQTPLKNSDAVLNWGVKDGFCYAEFSGLNNFAITKEAEILFRKMNSVAGRDLRLVNDQSTIVYTYSTNYTDKMVLINTLTEHGAEEILEQYGEISCKLFGMEMIYYKNNSESAYTLDITRVSNKDECQDLINDLNDEYALNIQEVTYNKIKERLDKENLRLESESVLEDNSIILTIEV